MAALRREEAVTALSPAAAGRGMGPWRKRGLPVLPRAVRTVPWRSPAMLTPQEAIRMRTCGSAAIDRCRAQAALAMAGRSRPRRPCRGAPRAGADTPEFQITFFCFELGVTVDSLKLEKPRKTP